MQALLNEHRSEIRRIKTGSRRVLYSLKSGRRSPPSRRSGWRVWTGCGSWTSIRTPPRFEVTHGVRELREEYEARTADELEATRPIVVTAGRVLSIRSFGKASFLVLSAGGARMQVYVRRDSIPENDFAVFRQIEAATTSAQRAASFARGPTS